MRRMVLTLLALMLAGAPAFAQETAPAAGDPAMSNSSGSGMGRLLSQGYEIRAAVPNGTRYIVFLQKRPVSLCLRIRHPDDIAVRFD